MPHICPACGAAKGGTLIVSEMMFGTSEKFSFAICESCGTHWLEDVPADLSAYYPAQYYSMATDPEVVFGSPAIRQLTKIVGSSALFGENPLTCLPAWAATHCVPHKQLRNLMALYRGVRAAGLAHGPRTRVLDVGCGSGIAIGAIALAGIHDPVGIDPFTDRSRKLSTGGRIQKSGLDEVEGQFDLVCFHHSFEHVVDPETDLRKALTLLAPGGRLLLRMPTVSSLAYETYAESWIQLDPPRHTVLFSRQGMTRLADRVSARIVATHDDSNSFGFWGSEQTRANIPLVSDESFATTGKPSCFTVRELIQWEHQAQKLNKQHQGDQAAWVLTRD